MYVINQPHPLQNAIASAVGFYNDLRAGSPGAWDAFPSEDIRGIKENWQFNGGDGADAAIPVPDLNEPLSANRLRQIGRALTAYIAAHDGRYSLLLDVIGKSMLRHPNPYALGVALANAEETRAENRTPITIQGLDKGEDSMLRFLASRIVEAFNSPGQVMTPCLLDVGVQKQPEPDLEELSI